MSNIYNETKVYVYYGNEFVVCIRLHCADSNPFTDHAKDVVV